MVKKNFLKKIVGIALGVVLGIGVSMPVFADYRVEVGWSDEPCPLCGEETAIWITEVYKEAYAEGQDLCIHYNFGVDLKMVQRSWTEYECRECNYSWETPVREHRYLECHGSDKAGELGY